MPDCRLAACVSAAACVNCSYVAGATALAFKNASQPVNAECRAWPTESREQSATRWPFIGLEYAWRVVG